MATTGGGGTGGSKSGGGETGEGDNTVELLLRILICLVLIAMWVVVGAAAWLFRPKSAAQAPEEEVIDASMGMGFLGLVGDAKMSK